MISIAVFQQSASQTSHQLKNRRKLTVVDINEHLRRHISSISIPKIRKLAYHPVLCGPCTHGFAIGNRSSGIKGFAPALTKNTRYSTPTKREGRFEKNEDRKIRNVLASATCFLILWALARLTTGPRFDSGIVGSPSLYF